MGIERVGFFCPIYTASQPDSADELDKIFSIKKGNEKKKRRKLGKPKLRQEESLLFFVI